MNDPMTLLGIGTGATFVCLFLLGGRARAAAMKFLGLVLVIGVAYIVYMVVGRR